MSLITKYRPKTLKRVLGQDEVVASITALLKKGDVPHSFLFSGPSGVGKTTIARIIAKELVGGEATEVNIQEVDAATHNGIDQMRALAKNSYYRAVGKTPVKVIIVDEAHRVTGPAWDSLLKIIEEPPAHVYWMLCTTAPGKIPETVRNRCVSYTLKSVDEDDLEKLLKRVVKAEELDVVDGLVELIANEANGSPRRALSYLESCLFAESIGEARKLLRSAGESKEVIDLCRLLIARQGRSWSEALKIVNDLAKTMDAEGVRIVIVNYLAKVLMDTKDAANASKIMYILDCFSEEYNSNDKFAPLLLSLGAALGLNE